MYVYVISAGDKRHKIGIAQRPEQRVRDLQTGSCDKLRLVHSQPAEHARAVEQRAHSYLRNFHIHGEWFACSETQAISMVGAAYVNDAEEWDPEYQRAGGWSHEVGDVVECRSSGEPWLGGPKPTPGRMYTISCVYRDGDVDVAEVQNDDLSFCQSMFWPARHRRFVREEDAP